MKIQTKHSIHFIRSAHSTNNSEALGIAGRRLSELAFFKLPIMPSVIIDHYIAQILGEESLASLLQANLKAFALEIGKEYGENLAPMLLSLRPSPNLHYVDCPTLSYVGLTGKNVRTIQKNVGKDEGRAILFAFLDSLFDILSKIEELETDEEKKTSLRLKIFKMKEMLEKRKKTSDIFDVIEMYSEVFPHNFFEDVKVQLDVALRLIIRLSILQKEEVGIVVEPIFYASDDSFCFGYCFTRNTATGNKELEGEFFQNTVYFCRDKPKSLDALSKEYLEKLEEIASVIEEKKKDIHKMTFAINNKKLYLLDATVEPKVSIKAKLIFLLELYNKKIIKADQLIKSIDASCLSEFDWKAMQASQSVLSTEKTNKKTKDVIAVDEQPLLNPKQLIDVATSFIKTFKVQANVENIEDVKKAICLGADGIGVFKTEKMLLSKERINLLRGIFFSKNLEKAQSLYEQLIKIQADEFYETLKFIENAPITIRLFNVSINDVLPVYDSEVEDFIRFMSKHNIIVDTDEFDKELCVLREANPEVGIRGCRIWNNYHQVYEIQLTAIFEAIYRLKKENIDSNVSIAIPLINYAEEMRDIVFGTQLKNLSYKGICAIEEKVRKKHNLEKVAYKVGSIIETPSAALKAEKIICYADFLVFDAVSLTERTLSISRNSTTWMSYLTSHNSSSFADVREGFLLDESVQELINNAVIRASMVRSNATFTLFIDHMYARKSMDFFMDMQGNYLSCSSDDVPIVLLEIAQAEIRKEEKRLEERRFKR